MTSKESLKRIRQETAPATYMKDFDKKECCDTIEKDLEILEKIEKNLKGFGFSQEYQGFILKLDAMPLNDMDKLMEWIEKQDKGVVGKWK